MLDMIARLNGNGSELKRLDIGKYQIGHFSSDILLYGRTGGWDFQIGDLPTHGVCDSPEQFAAKFDAEIGADDRNIAVFFTHVKKDPSNKGNGGGWRWHKWGEYIGAGEPQCEYLDDEDGFEGGVYVYQIHDIDNP